MKKAFLLVAAIAIGATACGGSGGDSAQAGDGGKKEYTIGVSNLGLSFPFPAAIGKGIKDEAARLGVKIVELDAQGKADKQSNDIQDLMAQQPDGVLMLPVDSGVAQGLADRLKAAGIPTVAVASQVGDPKTRPLKDVYPGLVALVTQDEYAAGGKAGEIAAQVLPGGGKIAVVEGAAGFAEVVNRWQEFPKAAEAKGATFEVVARQPGDWVQDKAQSACQNMLAANPDIQLFYAQSDDMSVGCAKAVKSAGSKAKVIGIGGSKLGIDAVKSGDVSGTVCFKPEDLGKLALDTLYKHLTGEKKQNAAFVTYDTPPITKDNVADCTPQW
ncbi:ribose transport system substrate-binding protein [Thermocatellispora tengchongensis]|uniref:Ribose transport system substrate-binding protein n=1 Tax=Thermocatellispora tengchongensis TaxID=1073253 RepID=A0A840P9N8_9ACTN|nr:sugar ABC transporter substrate-binding protein [Thermocatellispora tengchongensis]MBB5138094.1 ribose transport system substrate-binding protein [Thermocatellispora tengchongensis]